MNLLGTTELYTAIMWHMDGSIKLLQKSTLTTIFKNPYGKPGGGATHL